MKNGQQEAWDAFMEAQGRLQVAEVVEKLVGALVEDARRVAQERMEAWLEVTEADRVALVREERWAEAGRRLDEIAAEVDDVTLIEVSG